MQVSLLTVTPVKSLAVHHPDYVDLSVDGIVGDRAFFLVDDEDAMVSCTYVGDLLRYRAEYDAATGVLDVRGPDGTTRSAVIELRAAVATDFYGLRTVRGHVVEGWDELFSGIAGRPVRLVKGSSRGFDVAGVTLIGTRTVTELGSRNHAEPVDARRFRMNIEFSEGESLEEDTWQGRALRVGSAVVTVGGPVKRCAATTRNPDTGDVDLRTLHTAVVDELADLANRLMPTVDRWHEAKPTPAYLQRVRTPPYIAWRPTQTPMVWPGQTASPGMAL